MYYAMIFTYHYPHHNMKKDNLQGLL